MPKTTTQSRPPAVESKAVAKTSVLIVDDHPMVRERLAELINAEADLVVCGEAEDAHGAMKFIDASEPDIAIVDISLKDSYGIELIKDLKARDMLKDTLIVWAGEFGRTPMSQGGSGRDHHNHGYSIWMAGGGIKGGLAYGATDELGYAAVENVVTVHDVHATMLHLLGIEHERFTYRFQGLDAKLSGVEPCRVLTDILA